MRSAVGRSAVGRSAVGLIAFVLACVPHGLQAQAFPVKPIRVIVPFVAGGSSDIVARAIGSKSQEILGQPAIVENHPGANGAVAAAFVVEAEPVGYRAAVSQNLE